MTSVALTTSMPGGAKLADATSAELRRLERRMEDRWRVLALAEQRHTPLRALERMYLAYTQSVDEYIRCQRRAAQPRHWPSVA